MIPQIPGYSYNTNFQFNYTQNDNPIIKYREIIVIHISDTDTKKNPYLNTKKNESFLVLDT